MDRVKYVFWFNNHRLLYQSTNTKRLRITTDHKTRWHCFAFSISCHPQVGTHHRWACRRACQHCRVPSDRGSWAEWCPTAVRLLARREATCWPPRDALPPEDSSVGLLALAGWDLAPGLNTGEREKGHQHQRERGSMGILSKKQNLQSQPWTLLRQNTNLLAITIKLLL